MVPYQRWDCMRVDQPLLAHLGCDLYAFVKKQRTIVRVVVLALT